MTEVPEIAGAAASVGAQTVLDRPDAYISRDRRRALRAGQELPDRVTGAALFADISGFTPLTEALALELGAQRGAEELTASLNRVFHAIIDVLHEHGGDVIYFSGDAITCWLDGDDGARAAACGLAMQDAIARVGTVTTPAGAEVQLGMKVAVAVGSARRFVVGDPDIQLIEVLAGRLVDDLAAAEGVAERGEVVLEDSALRSLEGRVVTGEPRRDDESGGLAAVLLSTDLGFDGHIGGEPESALSEDIVRSWLLPVVYERMRTGRGEFLAELRNAVPVFVRFSGIDYDDDDDAIVKLDDFVRRSQRVFAEHGGNLLQLTLGDKGAYLYAVFGSPQAHEDDAARACAAALQIVQLEGVTAAREIQVGVTHGRLRSGTYGHDWRRTFVCLGDAVNLAARLMSKAPPGHVYVTDAVRGLAGDGFAWERLPDMTVKGKATPIGVYELGGLAGRAPRRSTRYELPIVGRRAELAALEEALVQVESGKGAIVGISAEAGIGKSRLVAEFVRRARGRGRRVAFGECLAFGSSTSYAVWREIWRELLGVDDADAGAERVSDSLAQAVASIDPALVPRVPLLGPLLGLSIADNELTSGLDVELRKTSLESLLADALRGLATQPLVLVLEDCHWIDPLSRDLLEVLARAAAALPILVILAYRPSAEPGGGLGLERLPHFSELPMSELADEDAEELIRIRLEPVLGEGVDPPGALVELVAARSQGNPFYIEELLNYVQAQGVDFADERALAGLQVPESLNSLILSRIDTLTEEPRRTLKVASVMGRTFYARALPEVYPDVGSVERVRGHLAALQEVDLVRLDREDEEAYIFKHVVTRDVAYESMPFALRSLLHEQAGGYLESSEPDAVEQNLDLLAHHFWHSRNGDKKREYLVRAGEAAKAKYANVAAVDYFERAEPLLDGRKRWQVLRALGEVKDAIGDLAGAEASYRESLRLAEEAQEAASAGWTQTSLADLARKRGEFDEATGWLDDAERNFESVDEQPGLGRVEHIRGVVANVRGDRRAARRHMEKSLEIRREEGDKVAMGALYSNLAMVAEYEGDYERSCELHEEGLALRIEAGDVAGIATSQMNLGVMLQRLGRIEEGRARQEESLRVRREIGNPRMIALAEHNLGILERSQGDYDTARELFASALRVQWDQGDKWALPFMLEDVAVLATLVEEHDLALRLAGAAAALREETRAWHGVASQAELDEQLAPARAALGTHAEPMWQGGMELALDEAAQLALDFCDDEASLVIVVSCA